MGSLFQLGGALYCQQCVADAEQRAQGSGEAVRQAVDPTICANCRRDNGSAELPRLSGVPMCERCVRQFRERPFPGWLKLAFVGLLLLLAASLHHGRPYFEAGRKLVRAERLMEARQFGPASALLTDVLKVAPDSEKVILLKVKADLLSGHYNEASALAEQHKDRKFKNALIKEINQIFERATQALTKAQEATARLGEDKSEEAARLMREASTTYPEYPELADGADRYEASAAFDRKEYDRYLAISEKLATRNPDDPDDAARLANALACRYALRGEESVKQRTLAMLDKALALSAKDPEAQARLEGVADRIRYRLESRQIISRKEYERRFGTAKRGSKS